MKENLNIQFVYPDYHLPDDYIQAIDTIDHTDIKPLELGQNADVIVLGSWRDCAPLGSTCIVRCTRKELFNHMSTIKDWLTSAARLNVVLTDIESFSDADIDSYKLTLDGFVHLIIKLYSEGKAAQFNLLTDRLVLDHMNNCNAGVESITLAPNGKFYICPAFYYEDEQQTVGDLISGLCIKNQQLLQHDHAPICRVCDAYHCRRCVWINKRLTGDINTPSHQQCVIAHLERNASRLLQQVMEKRTIRLEGSKKIAEIDYLDPFNIATRWKKDK